YKYQGCYTDNRDDRTLTGKIHYDDSMTLKKCATACSNYQWFGVTFGSQCFCGTSLADATEKRPEEECGMKCAGSKCQKCGDADRINVYWTGKDTVAVEPPLVGDFKYQSCWTDDKDDRSLTGGKHQRPDLTVEACAEICKDFRYFGLESSSECLCGNELGGEAAPEGQCSQLCPGNPEQWCGGSERMNVYTNTVLSSSTTTAEVPISTSTAESTTVTLPVEEETTTTVEPQPTSTVTLPDDGGFENGALWTPSAASGNAISVEVSRERVRSGNFALKAVFDNSTGSSKNYVKTVSLLPGRTYEASWWWWSEKVGTHTVSRMMFNGGGTSFVKDAGTQSGPAGQWVKATHQFTAGATVGSVTFSVYGNKAADSNTFYVDDISIVTI
ncbi:WSC domain-containing protein, partial [Apiosordaria backusii]